MTLCELHSLARACGVPPGRLHEVLHDAAVAAFKVGSMSQLNPDQCEKLATIIRSWDTSRDASAKRHGTYYRYSSRPRSGRPDRPGVIRAITPLQRETIYKIANQLRWTREIFNRWLQAEVGVDSPDRILTSAMACKVIQGLIKRSKQQRYPQPPARRGGSKPWGHREERAVQPPPAVPAGYRRESAQEFFGRSSTTETRRSDYAAQASP